MQACRVAMDSSKDLYAPGETIATGARPRSATASATRAKLSMAHCLVSRAAAG